VEPYPHKETMLTIGCNASSLSTYPLKSELRFKFKSISMIFAYHSTVAANYNNFVFTTPSNMSLFIYQQLSHDICKIIYSYFDVVVGFVWLHDPKSYAGGSVCYW
jgi:hypothetical protein